MLQHREPDAREFLRVVWLDWAALVSGVFTIPFTIAAILLPSGYGRAISGVMAILALLATSYRIWASERRQRVLLELHLAPRLRLEFDPHQPKFLHSTLAIPMSAGSSTFRILYVRVLARSISPVVNGCRAYLQRISQWNGAGYVPLFEESIPLPWSYENPESVKP